MTMSDSNGTHANGNGSANGASESVQISTLPGPNHDYRISLKDKVIASECLISRVKNENEICR
jgi:hypothetical protein